MSAISCLDRADPRIARRGARRGADLWLHSNTDRSHDVPLSPVIRAGGARWRAEASNGFPRQAFHVANVAIFGLENELIIYLGAQAALAGEMTVGMLFAFISSTACSTCISI